MKSIVLVITVTLSKGTVITFELSDSTYTCRLELMDDEGMLQEQLQIIVSDDKFMHSFDLKTSIWRRIEIPVDGNRAKIEESFKKDVLMETIVDGCELIVLGQDILRDSKIASFYLRVDEIDQLLKTSSFLKDKITYNENYLYVFADFARGNDEMNGIEHVEVEWESSFSEDVLQSLQRLSRSTKE